MADRTIAIGDIHGCTKALAALIEAIHTGPEDTLIMLGDYIDRGQDSRGVLEQLIALGKRCLVHAYYEPKRPFCEQTWGGLRRAPLPPTQEPHRSGKVAVVGHTPQKSGQSHYRPRRRSA
jgi:Calcineurin-like phosphoesterase